MVFLPFGTWTLDNKFHSNKDINFVLFGQIMREAVNENIQKEEVNATAIEVPLDTSGCCMLTTWGLLASKGENSTPECGNCSGYSKKRKTLKRQHKKNKKHFK